MIDKRLEQVSHRRASVGEVMALVERYRRRHAGWNVKPFQLGTNATGLLGVTWVKNRLQEAGVVQKAPGRGKHRKRRTRAAWPGMMLHPFPMVSKKTMLLGTTPTLLSTVARLLAC